MQRQRVCLCVCALSPQAVCLVALDAAVLKSMIMYTPQTPPCGVCLLFLSTRAHTYTYTHTHTRRTNLVQKMNIFGLQRHAVIAASMHCDSHVVKMIVETAQILYTFLRSIKAPLPTVLDDAGNELPSYASTHASHPCVLWLHGGHSHVAWLLNLGLALCDRYTLIYTGDKDPALKVHATQFHLVALRAHLTKEVLPGNCDAATWLQRLADVGVKPTLIEKCAGKVATFNPPMGCAFGVVCVGDNLIEPVRLEDGRIDYTATYIRFYVYKQFHAFKRDMTWNRQTEPPPVLKSVLSVCVGPRVSSFE